MKPSGLAQARDKKLNAALAFALAAIVDAVEALGVIRRKADRLMVDTFARAAGLLLLAASGFRGLGP
jgi:hypothetical protein